MLMKNILNKMQKVSGWFFVKGAGILSTLAMAVFMFELNSACTYVLYQPNLPKGSEKLKRG